MKAILNFSNNRISRSNSLLTGLIPLVLVFILACSKAKTPPTQAPIDPNALVLSGPPASVSFPLAYMVATGALKDAAPSVVFKMWMTPDQMRALALDGKTAFMAVPSNVAANLYNKGAQIKPLNISTWGILFMLSRDKERTKLADYKNEEIVLPFRGDMPDIVFQLIAEKEGLDVKKDFKIRYVSSPLDAMQFLLTRRARHVVLPEPAVSMALRKSGSMPLKLIAPDLFRSLSFQDEWAQAFKRKGIMPQAGLVALGKAVHNTTLVKRVNDEYSRALKNCLKDAIACGKLIAPYFDKLTPEAISDSLKVTHLDSVSMNGAKDELQYFFQKLFEKNPALLGGKMPDANFYR